MNSKDLEEKIEALLKKYQKHLNLVSLSHADGFFTAICCTKEPIFPSEWIPALWHEKTGEPNWKSDKEHEDFIQTFVQYYNFVVSMLSDKSFIPIVLADDKGKPGLFVWCMGFIFGKELWGELSSADNALLEKHFKTIDKHGQLASAELHLSSSIDDLDKDFKTISKDVQALFAYFEQQRLGGSVQSPFQPPFQSPFQPSEPKVGRNDPCPCGSGKKYKHCCLRREEDSKPFADELGSMLDGADISSLEEAKAHTNQLVQQKNLQALDDFHGLSPEQMQAFLYSPFESPEFVRFKEPKTKKIDAPIWELFKLMTDAIGEKGLKSTAKGNLPQKFCREAAVLFRTSGHLGDSFPMRGINKEEDYYDLHVTRVVAEMAGLIHKPKNHFMLTSECQQLLAEQNHGVIFLKLLKAYTLKFNWGYDDGFPEVNIIQQSFVFSLYLLSRNGKQAKHQKFYEDAFLTAFPMALDMAEASEFFTPEEDIRRCYTMRIIHGFVKFFGFAALTTIEGDKPYLHDYKIKKLPLLDELVQFVIGYHANLGTTKH